MIATDPAPKTPVRAGRLAALDGLRFVAALMVVAYHYLAFGSDWGRPRAEVFPVLHLPASYGWLGVQLFFLISGFVICLSGWGRSLSDFFTSRVIRLFPAYWLAVLVTTLVLALVQGGTAPRGWQDVLTNLTMFEHPFGAPYVDAVYWSLWAEARFYLIFALVVWRGLTYRRVLTFCMVWLAAGVLAYGLPNEGLLQLLVMPEYCWFFVGGIAFYLIRRFGPDLLLWLLVGFTYLAGVRAVEPTFQFVQRNTEYHLPDLAVPAVLALCYLLMAGIALGWFDRIDWRWLTTAGAVTYPLYLLHEYIGWELIEKLRYRVDPWLLVTALLVLMLAAAWLVNRYVERPLSRWMRRHLRNSFARVRAVDEQVAKEGKDEAAAGRGASAGPGPLPEQQPAAEPVVGLRR
ncbi:acyltransferase family protein [Kitasatospora sp. NPDC056138]|uniref:acyltransferase family protein n=1 Tax=Kitasatospora sp. NPDC056138 TaxID=3345724 RepID=UPI0035E1F957